MKPSIAHRLLPFKTFGEAAAFDLEVEVSCQCRRRVVIDGMAPAFRDRRIMGTRFRCTTILPHGAACTGLPSIYIRKRGRGRWTMADHSRAIRARQAAAPIDAKPGTFASIVKRCEVAFLYDRGCVPSYTVDMIEFDEPPWDRFLDKPWGRFICPGCGKQDPQQRRGPDRRGRKALPESLFTDWLSARTVRRSVKPINIDSRARIRVSPIACQKDNASAARYAPRKFARTSEPVRGGPE